MSDQAMDGRPITILTNIFEYHIITKKGHKNEQVLVYWIGLVATNRSWENLDWVSHLNLDSNLEDKVRRNMRVMLQWLSMLLGLGVK